MGIIRRAAVWAVRNVFTGPWRQRRPGSQQGKAVAAGADVWGGWCCRERKPQRDAVL